MHLDPIRMSYRFQRVPFMPWLSAAFLPALLAQTTFGRSLLQSVARRRLAAVAAVLRQLVSQSLHFGCQYGVDFDQPIDQRNDRLFTLLVCGTHFILRRIEEET